LVILLMLKKAIFLLTDRSTFMTITEGKRLKFCLTILSVIFRAVRFSKIKSDYCLHAHIGW